MKEGNLAKIAKKHKGRKEVGHSCLNSCSGEAGSLRGLGDLCER